MSAERSQSPFLVRSTESGAYFQKPLATALRGIAVVCFAMPLTALFASTKANEQLAGPLALLGLGMLVAAVMGGQVLFSRARRIGAQAGAVRFPVTPALRECARGVAEAYYVWSMVLAAIGLVSFLWSLDFEHDSAERLAKQVGTALATAAAVAFVGWLVLLIAHLVTELATVVVEVANNTARGGRSIELDEDPPTNPPVAAPAAAATEPAAPANPKARMAALGVAGVLLAGGTWAMTSTDDTPEAAPPAPASAAPGAAASALLNTANRIRAAEGSYDASHDGFLSVTPGLWTMVSTELALTYGPELEDCTVTASDTGFEVRCSVDKDGDGCALTVTASNDQGARTQPGTEDCT